MYLRAPGKMRELLESIPPEIRTALERVIERSGASLYLVGGTVRDCLLQRITHDLDIAADGPVLPLVRLFREELGGGTVIDLSGPDDEVIRVVWQGEQIDFSIFRAGVATIEEDLVLRDFTLNAIAVSLLPGEAACLIDPTGGVADLRTKLIRHCFGAFAADPVRMLRGYRLAAVLGFQLAAKTIDEVRANAPLIARVAAERISNEMRMIFASTRTAETLEAMHRVGLLRLLLPELYAGEGVEQPEFHHLDVLDHSFLALQMVEQVIADPGRYFTSGLSDIVEYLEQAESVVCLKWAALMHDIGKPATKELSAEDKGRVTFYRHDEEGCRIFQRFAERSRWSSADTERTSGLINMHMHPFHLCNLQRDGRVTRRAALNICRRAGEDMPGLFLLAMSDSLASKGEKKPEHMEEELAGLFAAVRDIYDDYIKPVLSGPRLVTGNDLVEIFGLVPGPLFSEILNELEIARVEGAVDDRQKALCWVDAYLHGDRLGSRPG